MYHKTYWNVNKSSIDFMLNDLSCILMEPKNNYSLFEDNKRPKIY